MMVTDLRGPFRQRDISESDRTDSGFYDAYRWRSCGSPNTRT